MLQIADINALTFEILRCLQDSDYTPTIFHSIAGHGGNTFTNRIASLASSLQSYVNKRNEILEGNSFLSTASLQDTFNDVQKASDLVIRAKIQLSDEINKDYAYRDEGISIANKGFSRNPFLYIADDNDAALLALASVTYILRGFCRFYGHTRNQRDFNSAKVALNDFHQAYQLTWCLYQSLNRTENVTGEVNSPPYPSLSEYYQAVLGDVRKEPSLIQPGRSAYFIWSTLLLCEIMRGNVYRSIHYLEEADRYYRHAEKRFYHFCEKTGILKFNAITTNFQRILFPTIVKAIYERSKVRFDLGQFLESLITQVNCIRYIILLKSTGDMKERFHAVEELDIIIDHIDAQRALPIFSRYEITKLFEVRYKGDTPQQSRYFIRLLPAICENSHISQGPLLIQIMARIGFTLFTVFPKVRPKDSTNTATNIHKWIKCYFEFNNHWNNHKRSTTGFKPLAPSHLGRYCQTIFYKAAESEDKNESLLIDEHIFSDNIERKFSLLLRQATLHKTNQNDDLEFYRNILTSTTDNIGNIVTIPRRNRSILMRRGYIYRRLQGDLVEEKCGNYSNEPKVQVESPETTDAMSETYDLITPETDPRHKLNKFVVLRRWQSFNPKIPQPSGHELRGGGYFLIWHGRGIVIDPGYNFIQNFYDEGFSLEDIDAVIVSHSHPDHDDDFANLTTLIKEWNEYHYSFGNKRLVKKLDIFLNESTHKKFSAWLQASKVKIGRVILLPLVNWDKNASFHKMGSIRGRNVVIDLRRQTSLTGQFPDYDYDLPGLEKCSDSFYDLTIEVIPAWHDDVISKTTAIGLKFELFDYEKDATATSEKSNETKSQDDSSKANWVYKKTPSFTLGFTGDSGAYGLCIDEHEKGNDDSCLNIAHMYEDCDILIAHLGDIRLRELSSVLQHGDYSLRLKNDNHPIVELLRQWFKSLRKDLGVSKKEAFSEQFVTRFGDLVHEYLNLLITLDMVPDAALKLELPIKYKNRHIRIQEWFGLFMKSANPDSCFTNMTIDEVDQLIERYHNKSDRLSDEERYDFYHNLGILGTLPKDLTISNPFEKQNCQELIRRFSIRQSMNDEDYLTIENHIINFKGKDNEWINSLNYTQQSALFLLCFIASCSLIPWQYPYHLGIFGIYKMFTLLRKYWIDKNNVCDLEDEKFDRSSVPRKIFVVGELPEELASYRQKIAYFLNGHPNATDKRERNKIGPVKAFTGDIGLHIRMRKSNCPQIRCAFCNYNHEKAKEGLSYHSPERIYEISIKRFGAAMIYLCEKHYPGDPFLPAYFLNQPYLRII